MKLNILWKAVDSLFSTMASSTRCVRFSSMRLRRWASALPASSSIGATFCSVWISRLLRDRVCVADEDNSFWMFTWVPALCVSDLQHEFKQ